MLISILPNLSRTVCPNSSGAFTLSITKASTFSIIKFIILAVIVQVTHDILFYLFFENVPRGMNKMLDTFKDYAKDVSYKAILADSGMIIMASLIASYLASKSLNVNIITLILSL